VTFATSGQPAVGFPPSDEDLLLAAARGDQSAVGLLYDRLSASMYGLALRITGDATLAQDVVQEAFVGVWRNAARFDGARASARTWVMSITHHRAIDALRRRRPAAELPDPELPPPAALVTPDIWGEVAGRLDAARVHAAVATLSDVQRQAIELAYFGGLTQQEIAERIGAPLGTVKSRVRLGLLALRDALRDQVEPGGATLPGGRT
jgi:RNA polymerase sigma-70 factor (ECF subfamily)